MPPKTANKRKAAALTEPVDAFEDYDDNNDAGDSQQNTDSAAILREMEHAVKIVSQTKLVWLSETVAIVHAVCQILHWRSYPCQIAR